MLLVYNSRAITKDVDAVIVPEVEGREIVAVVAKEFGFDRDWLNSDVSQFLAPVGAKRPLAKEFQGLKVSVPTASYLLALKAMASRRALPGYSGDEADLRFLLRKMNIGTVAEVQSHIDRYFPDDVLPDQHAALIKSILGEVHSDDR